MIHRALPEKAALSLRKKYAESRAAAVLGRTGRVDDRGVYHRALAQQQTAPGQLGVDRRQHLRRQAMALQQVPEGQHGLVEDRIARRQRCDLARRFFHSGSLSACPRWRKCSRSMLAHGRGGDRDRPCDSAARSAPATASTAHLVHLGQEPLAPSLLALAGVLGVGEGRLRWQPPGTLSPRRFLDVKRDD